MLEVTILASGSNGNALLLRSARTTVLVDAGISARRLVDGLRRLGSSPEELSGILLTHEHGDHTQGLKVFCRKHPVPIYANPHTAQLLQANGVSANWKLFATGSEFHLADLSVTAFNVPHDAADPVGFCIASEGITFGVLTDLGHVPEPVLERIRGVHGLLLEANYDTGLLESDLKRPWPVKQRISSRHGHLSNDAAAEILTRLTPDPHRKVILGHLSRDCNSPQIALERVIGKLGSRSGIIVASPDQPGEPIRIG